MRSANPSPSRYRWTGVIRQWLTAGTRRQARPAGHRLGGANDVHAGSRVALEGGIRLVGVVDDSGNDDRRRAVLEQVGALGEPISRALVRQQVIDRPREAVALGLARHDDR